MTAIEARKLTNAHSPSPVRAEIITATIEKTSQAIKERALAGYGSALFSAKGLNNTEKNAVKLHFIELGHRIIIQDDGGHLWSEICW